jgi:hypoxanthine-DNA glycosylase
MKLAFLPIVDQKSKILLLGTMPGEQSLKLQQYYGHRGNQFWKIVFNLFNQSFSDNYEIKRQLLLSKGIALWDVLENCEREGSSDHKIKNEVANDFASFYQKFPSVKNVFFTSKKAEEFYGKYVHKNSHVIYHNLPSPSSANTWKTFEEKVAEWKIIVNYL